MKMKEEKGVFSTRLRTDFGECDFLKRLKISAVLKYLAETSGLDYAQKGYPHRCLLEKGEVFLLTRISCRFHKDVGEEQPLFDGHVSRLLLASGIIAYFLLRFLNCK